MPLADGRGTALLLTRKAPVQKLLWRIRAARDHFPASKLSVIAHSFGTYAIGRILRENPDIRLRRLILCGCILPSDFRWDQIRDRVEEEIINDCGTRDLWPVLAESTTFGYGPSGRFGFGTPGVRDRYHDFGHGGFFQSAFVSKFWSPWFRSGKLEQSALPPPSGVAWHILSVIQIKWVFLCLLSIWIIVMLVNVSSGPISKILAK
jgi:pimeloyl-ACP methyl ester carboxylesterase